jgi:hypothetical protein
MNRFTVFLAVTMLSTALLSAGAAQAMEIIQYDRMAASDQGDYIVGLLQGAHQILVSEGKADLAAKLHTLFDDVRPGDQMSIGELEFEANVDNVRLLDAERHAKDHSAVRLEVEHAMLITLKRNGIELPKAFMHVMDDFKPQHPLKDE